MSMLLGAIVGRLLDPITAILGIASYYVFAGASSWVRPVAVIFAIGVPLGMALPGMVGYGSPPAGVIFLSAVATPIAALAWFAIAACVRPVVNGWLDGRAAKLDAEDAAREGQQTPRDDAR